MKTLLVSLLAVVATACQQSTPPDSPLPGDSRQMILVMTDDAQAISGRLYRFNRNEDHGAWLKMSGPTDIVVGKSGLAWGRGLHPQAAPDGFPVKREGDGKSPAGIFTVSSVFGYQPAEEMTGLKMPYLFAGDALECVDDATSMYYNQIVLPADVNEVDWTSSEKMGQIGKIYHVGAVVEHNANPTEPGAGSCIFLHIWRNVHNPTIGCTAMTEGDMRRVAFWLEADKKPLLVQLTRPLYDQFRTPWGLPEISY